MPPKKYTLKPGVKGSIKPKKVVKIKPKKKAPKTIGKSITGLSKAQMNKLSPEELFGKLPVALRKKVLTSGTQVGVLNIDDIDDDDLFNYFQDEYQENFFSSRSYYGDYDILKGVTKKQSDFYRKNTREGLLEQGKTKAADRYEMLEEKILFAGLDVANDNLNSEIQDWRYNSKGKTFRNMREAYNDFDRFTNM